jgi:hypothetical protein
MVAVLAVDDAFAVTEIAMVPLPEIEDPDVMVAHGLSLTTVNWQPRLPNTVIAEGLDHAAEEMTRDGEMDRIEQVGPASCETAAFCPLMVTLPARGAPVLLRV